MFPRNIFIISGNPPAIHFYELWKNEIISTDPQAKVGIARFPVLEMQQESTDYFRNFALHLEQQFLDWRATIDEPVGIIGHSVGGYFALEILKRQHAVIDKVALIYPFLRAPTRRGRTILKVVQSLQRWPHFEAAALRAQPWLSRLNADLATMTALEVQACLRLAFHEQKVISKDRSELNIEASLRSKLLFLYCDEDTWCPAPLIETMKKQVQQHRRVNASHAFIVHAQERAELYRALQSL